jgi:peptidyl-prolyl cis-trans isomerase B (cyclophilin B)
VTSSRERQQRAAARAKLAREMAERQEAARRRRQRQAMLGAAGAVVLVVAGVVWAVTALTGEDPPPAPPALADSPEPADDTAAAPGECDWLPEDVSINPDLVDVGTPEAGDPPTGPATMTITTNHGVIEVEMDAEQAPCTYASFAHLAGQEFYDGTTCHRMVTEGIYVLQCGDPSGTGRGGPTYKFAEENLPTGQQPTYPRGTLAMAKTPQPATTGSQFFIVYDDSDLPPDYTVVGMVTDGLDIVDSIAADGAVDPAGETVPDGAPATEVLIETLRVSDPA